MTMEKNMQSHLTAVLMALGSSMVLSAPPNSTTASFQGSGSGVEQCSGNWGYQKVTYNLDVERVRSRYLLFFCVIFLTMVRPLRIEFADSLYHVTSRGGEGRSSLNPGKI